MDESGVVKGAAAGSALGPWGTAAGALLGAASDMSGGPNMGPSGVTGTTTSGFDSSGWNVNFGSGGITSTANKSSAPTWATYGLYALGLIVGYKLVKGLTK